MWAFQNLWLSNLANECSNTHRFLSHTLLALIASCTIPILNMRSRFLLRYRLSPNQLRPQVQLRPAPLCCGRLMHIHQKTPSLYAEANGLCNRSPWLCLLLSGSKHAQWSPKWTSKMVAQKCVAMDPPPFGAQPHVTSPTLNDQYEYMHNTTTFMFMYIGTYTTQSTFDNARVIST